VKPFDLLVLTLTLAELRFVSDRADITEVQYAANRSSARVGIPQRRNQEEPRRRNGHCNRIVFCRRETTSGATWNVKPRCTLPPMFDLSMEQRRRPNRCNRTLLCRRAI